MAVTVLQQAELERMAHERYCSVEAKAERIRAFWEKGDETHLTGMTEDEFIEAESFLRSKRELARQSELINQIEEKLLKSRFYRGKLDDVPDRVVHKAWCQVFVGHWRSMGQPPSIVPVDKEVGKLLGLSERSVRKRRESWGLIGEGLKRAILKIQPRIKPV